MPTAFRHRLLALAVIASLALQAGCATKLTVASPAFSESKKSNVSNETAPQSWWQTYGDAPRGP